MIPSRVRRSGRARGITRRRRTLRRRSGHLRIDGSIPLFLIAAIAPGDERNAINRFDASICDELFITAAAYVVTYCTASGIVPMKSTFGTGSTSLTCCNPISASPLPTAAAPFVEILSFIWSAIPSFGKSTVVSTRRSCCWTLRRLRFLSSVCFSASTALMSGLGAPAWTITPMIDAPGRRRSRDGLPFGDESANPSRARMITSAGTPRRNLRANGVRSASDRSARCRRDRHPDVRFEFRQQLSVARH